MLDINIRGDKDMTPEKKKSELKAGAGMLADMHDKKFDLEAKIKEIEYHIGVLMNRIKELENDNNELRKFKDYRVDVQCKESERLRNEIAALKARLKPVEDVYERFKHLDKLFSDKKWLCSDTENGNINRSLYDCWNALKSACENEQHETKK